VRRARSCSTETRHPGVPSGCSRWPHCSEAANLRSNSPRLSRPRKPLPKALFTRSITLRFPTSKLRSSFCESSQASRGRPRPCRDFEQARKCLQKLSSGLTHESATHEFFPVALAVLATRPRPRNRRRSSRARATFARFVHAQSRAHVIPPLLVSAQSPLRAAISLMLFAQSDGPANDGATT